MKKLIIFLLLATACLFTACEQPEGPQSLIGHWNVVGDHWTATFDEDGQLYIQGYLRVGTGGRGDSAVRGFVVHGREAPPSALLPASQWHPDTCTHPLCALW